MGVTECPVLDETTKMARSRKPDKSKEDQAADGRGRKTVGKQINVRVNDELLSALEEISGDTGLDLSSVIRMILNQNNEKYLQEARARRQAKEKRQ